MTNHNNKQKEGKKNVNTQGWECPKCGSVYAIWVSECGRCVNSNVKTFTQPYTVWAGSTCPICHGTLFNTIPHYCG